MKIASFQDFPEDIAFSSPFELRPFRYPLRATSYVSASCWYNTEMLMGKKLSPVLYASAFFVNVANLAACAMEISYISDSFPQLLLKC